MKLLIVTEVVSDHNVDPALYRPFIDELAAYLKNRVDYEVIESSVDAETKIVNGDISAVMFISRSMVFRARILAMNFSKVKFVVLWGRLDKDVKRFAKNLFLVNKGEPENYGKNFANALEIISS